MNAERETLKAELLRTIGLVVEPGQVVELRVTQTLSEGTVVGYYTDPAALADAALLYDGRAPVAITLNPVLPDLLARAKNRVEKFCKYAVKDHEILSRRWLLIDCDPHRPAGISATVAEHDAALRLARAVYTFLIDEVGVPRDGLILADSGNGAHILVRVDLPNDADTRELVRGCLRAIDFTFSDTQVSIDQTTGNAARICKLYGTIAHKGDSTDDRPHRRSRLLEAPGHPVVVPHDVLERLASLVPDAAPEQNSGKQKQRLDLDVWIREHNLDIAKAADWQGGRKWILSTCPFEPSHTDRSAYILQFKDGGIAAGCRHNGCAGKRWPQLRDVVEPGWRDVAHSEEQPPAQEFALKIFDLSELLTRATPDELVEGVLAANSLGSLVGQSGSGKSFIALDLCVAVAAGLPFHGRAVQQGPVVFVTSEGHAHLVKRIYTLLLHRGITSQIPLYVVEQAFDLMSEKAAPALCDALKRRGITPALIVIDPMSGYMGGDQDRATDIATLNKHGLTPIRERTGATVLVLVHAGWDPKRERGSSALRDIMDTVMLVDSKDPVPGATTRSVTLECKKQKDLPFFSPIHLELQQVPANGGRAGDTTCIVATGIPPATSNQQPAKQLKGQAKVAFSTLQQHPDGMGFTAWWKESGVKKTTFKDVVSRLVDDDLVTHGDDGIYRVVKATDTTPTSAGANGSVVTPTVESDESDGETLSNPEAVSER